MMPAGGRRKADEHLHRCGPPGRPHYDGPLRDRPPPPAAARRFAIALLVLCATAAPAVAHTSLIGTSPAADARLASAPAVVRVTYGAPLASVSTATVRLGAANVAGRARLDPNDARQVLIPLRSAAPGRYRVGWIVVGQDGHQLAGKTSFRVRARPIAVALRGMQRSLAAAARALEDAARVASAAASP